MLSILFIAQTVLADEAVKLYPGFITKIRCEGKLLVSAIGSPEHVKLEALPKELGCGVLLQPLRSSFKTNLFLETSTGSITRLIETINTKTTPRTSALEYHLKGDAR
ncbi:MAG: hypothetical protein AABZ55_05845 [Bdellovibrionota bacterium]